MMLGYDMRQTQIKNQKPHTETGYNPTDPVIVERPAIKFHPGDTLTSKANGAYILWDTTMLRTWQVAYVTDIGTIEVLK
jgi:hypothetical protein